MQSDTEQLENRSVRRARALLRVAVAAVWLVGVILAISSGWSPPGLRLDPSAPWPYPFAHVVIVIAQITLVSLCFYDFLRPRPTSSFRARAVRATIVAVAMLFWTPWNTDQPGYAYVSGTYVFLITVTLLVTLLVVGVIRMFSRGEHAA